MKLKSLRLFILTGLAMAVFTGCVGNSGVKTESSQSVQETKGTDRSDAITIKVSLTTAETHSCNQSFETFKQVLEEISGGQFYVEIYPNGQMGNDRESVEDVQLNNIQMTNISSAIVAQFEPSLAVFDLPFLFESRETLHQMFEDENIGGVLCSNMEEKGFKCLGFWDAGYRHLTNGKKTIKTPEDLKGMKIRTMSSDYHIKAWELYGATPTPVAFTELFTALQQGTVDGQENPYGLIVSQKFYEVQPYLSTTGHILTVAPLIISKEFYDSLTDQQQLWIQEAATEATLANKKFAEEEEETAKKEILSAGVEIYEMTGEEKEKFRDLAQPIYESMKETVDSKLIQAIVDFQG